MSWIACSRTLLMSMITRVCWSRMTVKGDLKRMMTSLSWTLADGYEQFSNPVRRGHLRHCSWHIRRWGKRLALEGYIDRSRSLKSSHSHSRGATVYGQPRASKLLASWMLNGRSHEEPILQTFR